MVSLATALSAASRASWTVPPPGCVCQPRKRLPSYSMPSAILINEKAAVARGFVRVQRKALGELGEQLLRLALLRGIAVLDDLIEQLAGTILIAHFLVGFRKIELGRDFLPFRISTARTAGPRRLGTEVQADGRQVHGRRRLRRPRSVTPGIEVQIKIEATGCIRGGGGRRARYCGFRVTTHAKVEVEATGAVGRLLIHDQRTLGREVAFSAGGRCRCCRAEIEIQSAAAGLLRRTAIERNIGRARCGGATQVEVERRRRGRGRRGSRNRSRRGARRTGAGAAAAIQTVLRIDGAAERQGLVPIRACTVGQALKLDRALLERLGVFAVR